MWHTDITRDVTMKNISRDLSQNKTNTPDETHHILRKQNTYIPANCTSGLADLQRSTTDALSQATQWAFSEADLKVKRHKLDKHTWQLTVVNSKTSKTILQAEGHGDTVFAHEESLARMAETLMAQGLTIRTQFDD